MGSNPTRGTFLSIDNQARVFETHFNIKSLSLKKFHSLGIQNRISISVPEGLAMVSVD